MEAQGSSRKPLTMQPSEAPHSWFSPERDLDGDLDDDRALLAAIVQYSNDAIISKTLEGRITSWNAGAERLFGFTEAEVLGQPITMIIPPDRIEEEDFILSRLRSGERIENFETIRQNRHGEAIDVSVTVSPVRNRRGEIVGASKIARDIRQQKLYAAALRDLDQRKDEFFAILSHELRSPLAPLLNAARLLREGPMERQHLDWLAEVLDRQVRQMARLIDDMLDVTRINAGKVVLDRKLINLCDILDRSVEETLDAVSSHGHALQAVHCDAPVMVEADADRLAQVFTNLIHNAAKYTHAGGTIWMTLEREADVAVIRVRDTGIGIAPEKLPAIFGIYMQVAEAAGLEHGGLGIGLSVARRLVELHGGSITASSPGLGLGSEFVVRLPTKDSSQQRTPDTSPNPRQSPRNIGSDVRRRILVADDNADSAATLAAVLRAAGHEVVIAADGVEALAAAQSFKPDIALLDLRLSKLSGEELVRRLRAECGGAIRLIAVTGYGQDADREASRNAGFERHLVKPIDLNALEELLAAPRTH